MIVTIKRLCVQTIIGAFKWERKTRRNIFLTITYEYDGMSAAVSDKLRDGVDYTALEQEIISAVQDRNYTLVETLADHVARIVMKRREIEWVTVEVDKPGVLRQADSVSITHTLRRKS